MRCVPPPASCFPGAAEQRCRGLWGRTVPETALGNLRGSSDNQVLWEHRGLLSRCNKCLGNPRPVEKHLYGASSSSADAEGTVTDVTEKLMLEIVKAF